MAGGVPEVMLHLRALGLLQEDVMTVTGESLGVTLDWWHTSERRKTARARLGRIYVPEAQRDYLHLNLYNVHQRVAKAVSARNVAIGEEKTRRRHGNERIEHRGNGEVAGGGQLRDVQRVEQRHRYDGVDDQDQSERRHEVRHAADYCAGPGTGSAQSA